MNTSNKREDRFSRSLSEILQHNKEGSFATYNNRSERLKSAVNELKDMGYQLKNVRNLKQKHIKALVQSWKDRGLSIGTIKNKMSDLRWLSRKIDNPRIVERDNKAYGIDNRKYVRNDINIAKKLENADLNKITDKNVQLSLRLQSAFGLRREEAIKFQVGYADKGDKIELKDSWCKGGRAREIPVRTDEQRQLLDEIKQHCKENSQKSLIPSDQSYKQQLKSYEYQTAKVGLNKNHGLRHQYAQNRYKELTGRDCPKNGGLTSRQLTPEQRMEDNLARIEISEELGHSREAITAVYLGR